MTWRLVTFALLAAVVAGGFAWYERARPPARLVALVAALAALAVAGRLVLAPIPNVVATTDVALLTGYALGPAPGFAVGALAAPISNIWLGQGPWTAWQMAGWGLVGVGGAWLATLTGRRLGRWGLAAACGVAGLAYGALLDLSVMVTYGGEQSLDRYLALSARGVPFNVAHAAGNVALALVAGPALVAMISRYRTRLEFTWRPAGALGVALAVVVACSAVIGPESTQAGGAAKARSWLAGQQSPDGGFAATSGARSSPAMTGWAMLGLEAAGRNPLDVREAGRSPVAFLRSRVARLRSTGDLERTILALDGAGRNPQRFGGRNLVALLRARRSGDGSFSGQVNLTAFGILALRAAGASTAELASSAEWLHAAQNPDGGWGFSREASSDPDSTGAALQGLAAAGVHGPAGAGVAYLRRTQRPGGGWGLNESGVTNTQSTAWAVQGLLAGGASPGGIRTGGKSALDYLAARRAADGHYAYSASTDQTPVWVTAQALLAVKRKTLPLAVVPRARKRGGGARPTGSEPGSPAGATAGGPSASAGGEGSGGDRGGPGAAESKGNASSPERGPASREGDASEAVPAAVAAEPTSTAAQAPSDDGSDTALYVAGGLGLLAAVLGAGFLWYRRRLP